jgi:uncharacterized membrane protein
MYFNIIMSRIDILDTIRGISFFPMCIFHIVWSYDLVNSFSTNLSSNTVISFFGQIRNIYILLAGISLALAARYKKNNTDYYFSRLKRSLLILLCGCIISVLTHFMFPNFGIKFGILHFMAIGTLLLSPIASNYLFIIIAFLLITFVKIPSINPFIDTITGASTSYNMADWFPLNNNLPLLLVGVLAGNIIYDYNSHDEKDKDVKTNKEDTILEWMGKESLNLYTGHMIIIITCFYLLKKFNYI